MPLMRMHHLSEFPLTVRVTHRNTSGFFDMLILNSGEEPIQETSGEIAGGLLCFHSESFAVLLDLYRFTQRDLSNLAVLHKVDNTFHRILFP